jgi:deazaflavin-dependent oxidoreductase (nitroreductase family)
LPHNDNPTSSSEPHISEFSRPVVAEFRANGGAVGGPFAGGNLLLLTTVGARSGREHTTPLGYVPDGDRLLVVGSAGGSPRHPDWYHNLLAHPLTRVEIGARTSAMVGVPAQGADRDRLFQRILRDAPGFADYQARVTRRLPVVVLEPVAHEPAGAQPPTPGGKLIEIHTWLRGQLRHVRAAAEAHFAARAVGPEPGAGAAVGLGSQLRQHCLACCEALSSHHCGEDAAAIDRLRAEHRTVARIRAELEALLADVGAADPSRFRAELDRMTAELEAHFDHEERIILPLLATTPPPAGQ